MKEHTSSVSPKKSFYRHSICALVSVLLAGAGIGNAIAAKTAIGGYDPVAYFVMKEAVKGDKSIKHSYLGEKWYFVNEEHRDMFKKDPMRYMPTFGGYCSYDETLSIFREHRHRVNPTAWRIVDGQLYLFSSDETAEHAMPEEKWKKVKAGLSQ